MCEFIVIIMSGLENCHLVHPGGNGTSKNIQGTRQRIQSKRQIQYFPKRTRTIETIEIVEMDKKDAVIISIYIFDDKNKKLAMMITICTIYSIQFLCQRDITS